MTENLKPKYELLTYYLPLRRQLLEILDDDDLAYSPGGSNLPLGDLIRENGEIETAYIRSFRDFSLDFGYRHPDPGSVATVNNLAAWLEDLDAQLKDSLEGISEEDAENRKIDRGGGFIVSPAFNLDVYREALLLFCGKAYVYLKVMGKALPDQWKEWL